MPLCIRCGAWKQSPMGRCSCGFKPERGSLDEARSYALTEQFRSEEEILVARAALQAGQPVSYGDEELRVAATIGAWNARVTFAWLGWALLAGLALAAIVSREWWLGAGLGIASVIGWFAAQALTAHVARLARLR